MKFGVFFFSSLSLGGETGGYDLMMEVARMADSAGFVAVWTPERHFDPFGGLFPNPALTSAALAMATQRLQLRAGSVVSPLHDAVRLAEDWSVVDNLSGGRAAVSFASGWHPNDFVLAPANFQDRVEIMFAQIAEIRDLWRSRRFRRTNPVGQAAELNLYPAPVQADLPIWVTSGGNARTFERAGEIGANVLTHLISQSVDELADRVRTYRAGRARCPAPSDQAIVSVMLHAYVGESVEAVRAEVRPPLKEYLRSAARLVQSTFALSGVPDDDDDLPADAIEEMLEITFDRYFEHSSLLGSEDKIRRTLDRLDAIGVNEVACLVDFGLSREQVLRSMERLCRLAG